jgi:hypothetical protein
VNSNWNADAGEGVTGDSDSEAESDDDQEWEEEEEGKEEKEGKPPVSMKEYKQFLDTLGTETSPEVVRAIASALPPHTVHLNFHPTSRGAIFSCVLVLL